MDNTSTYDVRLSNALKHEHGKIFDSLTKGLKPSVATSLNFCPVCKEPSYKIYCIKDNFVHKRCAACSFVYLDPRLNQEATLSFYNSDVNEIYNESKFHVIDENELDDVQNIKNYDLLAENVPITQGKKLLEIGPGKGTFLSKAVKEGFEVHCVELNVTLIDKLKTITNNVYDKDILEINLPENYFDVIYFRDVMEHISSVEQFLSRICKLLKSGGVLFIDTHNIDSIINSLTKEYHTVIFAFEHPVHWSPSTIKLACSKVGLKFKNLYFDHDYQSLGDTLNYILNPTFTYIYPPEKSKFKTLLLGFLFKVLQLKYFAHIERKGMTWLSEKMGRGSKMQILFTKD